MASRIVVGERHACVPARVVRYERLGAHYDRIHAQVKLFAAKEERLRYVALRDPPRRRWAPIAFDEESRHLVQLTLAPPHRQPLPLGPLRGLEDPHGADVGARGRCERSTLRRIGEHEGLRD